MSEKISTQVVAQGVVDKAVGKVEEITPIYIQRSNCTEEQVNKLILLGYTPWQITPVEETVVRGGNIRTTNTRLVFHFLRRKEKQDAAK